jgi:hypothetical protein
MSSDDAGWLGRTSKETYVEESIRVRQARALATIGRNGPGQQDEGALQCHRRSLIGIKQLAVNGV